MCVCAQVDGILRDMVIITLRTELTRIQRTNLETCITVHMHQKESTEDLLKKKIKDPTDFEWLKQVRFERMCMCVAMCACTSHACACCCGAMLSTTERSPGSLGGQVERMFGSGPDTVCVCVCRCNTGSLLLA